MLQKETRRYEENMHKQQQWDVIAKVEIRLRPHDKSMIESSDHVRDLRLAPAKPNLRTISFRAVAGLSTNQRRLFICIMSRDCAETYNARLRRSLFSFHPSHYRVS